MPPSGVVTALFAKLQDNQFCLASLRAQNLVLWMHSFANTIVQCLEALKATAQHHVCACAFVLCAIACACIKLKLGSACLPHCLCSGLVVAIMVQRRGYQCRCHDCNHQDGIFISLPCKGIHLSARGNNKLHRIPSSVLDNKYGCVCLGLPPNNNECDARIYIQIF